MSAPALALSLKFEPLRSLGFGSIGGGYMSVGSPLAYPARQILVQNLTDVTLVFSWDGLTDNFVLPTNGFLLLDITGNKTQQGGFYLAEGSQLYVNAVGASPASGSVYFSTTYGYGY